MKRFFLVLAFALFPFWALAADLNAGFVQGIWFNKAPFFAGNQVTIYTAFQNNSGQDITGTVGFFVDGQQIGQSDFTAQNGVLIPAQLTWTAVKGVKQIYAKVTAAKSAQGPVSLSGTATGSQSVFIDSDTDGDGIGDSVDPDIDGDGLSNTQEKTLGTNPLIADTDKDGASDGKEVATKTDPLNPKSYHGKITGAVPESVSKVAQAVIPAPTLSSVTGTIQQVDKFFQGAAQAVQAQKAALTKTAQADPNKPILEDAVKKLDAAQPLVQVSPNELPQQGPLLLLASAALDILSDGLIYWWVVVIVIGALFLLKFIRKLLSKRRR